MLEADCTGEAWSRSIAEFAGGVAALLLIWVIVICDVIVTPFPFVVVIVPMVRPTALLSPTFANREPARIVAVNVGVIVTCEMRVFPWVSIVVIVLVIGEMVEADSAGDLACSLVVVESAKDVALYDDKCIEVSA